MRVGEHTTYGCGDKTVKLVQRYGTVFDFDCFEGHAGGWYVNACVDN